MIELFLSILLLSYYIFASGNLFILFIFKKNNFSFELAEYGFLGIIFLTILTYIIHFFLPLNQINNFILFLIILILGTILNFNKLWNLIKSNLIFLIFSFFIVVLMSIKFKVNEDYGYYHLPYIVNLISEKVIFGLANLQVNFAWNSSWLNFSSILYLPVLELKGVLLSNSILTIYVFIFLLNEIIKPKNVGKLSFFYLLFLSTYIFIKFARISEHGFDLRANFFLLISFYYLLKIHEIENEIEIKKNFILLLFFSIYCVTIKLSTFISPFIFLVAVMLLIKKKIKINFLSKSLSISFFLFLLWTTQQFIYSGCFISFFDFTCFKNLPWYVQDITFSVSDATGAVNKSFNEYKGYLSKEEYIENFNWIGTWFNRNKIELSEHLISILFPIILLIILSYFNGSNKNLVFSKNVKHDKLYYILIFSISILGLAIWFIKSPVIRFGVPYIYIFIFLIFYYFLISKLIKQRLNYFPIYIILIVSLSFNMIKNFNRSIKVDKLEYWPEILNVKYSSNIIDDMQINFPNEKNDNYHKKKYCWSIPFICHMNAGNNLKFQRKNNYLIISKKFN